MRIRCCERDYGYNDTLAMDTISQYSSLYSDYYSNLTSAYTSGYSSGYTSGYSSGVKASCSYCGGTTTACCQDASLREECACCSDACLGGCDPGVKACLGGCDASTSSYLLPIRVKSTTLPARVKYINCCQ